MKEGEEKVKKQEEERAEALVKREARIEGERSEKRKCWDPFQFNIGIGIEKASEKIEEKLD